MVEDDLVAAIATLRGSTLAIERQTELLQSHHRYLNTFGNQRDEKNQAIQGAAGSIARKELLELQQLALQVSGEFPISISFDAMTRSMKRTKLSRVISSLC